jgi:hypothetical protein
MSDVMYSLVVGIPVTNCRGDGTSSIKSISEGVITIGETWSFDATIGFALMGLTIEGGPSWTRSKSISWSQNVEIEVKPGQMVRPTSWHARSVSYLCETARVSSQRWCNIGGSPGLLRWTQSQYIRHLRVIFQDSLAFPQ